MTGVKAEHIPYKGNAPAMMDLVAGRCDFNFVGLQGAQPLVRSGKLRALAVTAPKRVAARPDLPAMAEALPGIALALDASLIAWLAQNYATATPVILAGGWVAVLIIAGMIMGINRRAYRCIEELENA